MKGGVGTKEVYYTPGLADYKGAHIVAAGTCCTSYNEKRTTLSLPDARQDGSKHEQNRGLSGVRGKENREPRMSFW